MKTKLFFSVVIAVWYLLTLTSLAQFVEEPTTTTSLPDASIMIDNANRTANIFDVLILVSALIFIISLFGFSIGFIKLLTAGGNEHTIIASKKMLITSSWLFATSIFSYLIVNLIKYFVY